MRLHGVPKAKIATIIGSLMTVFLAAIAITTVVRGEVTVPATLDVGVFDEGGGVSESDTSTVQSVLGQPASESSESANFAVTPGSVAAAELVTDACPGLSGPDVYGGCPAGVDTKTTLLTNDQRRPPTACGTVKTCLSPQVGARVKVFDRNRLNGLTITSRDGRSVTLTKNPDGSLFDDIFESATAGREAGAASFGCVGDAAGSCIAAVSDTGDLLVVVSFRDTGRAVYAGRSLSTTSFADTDADGTLDRASADIQVIKTIDKTGTVTYVGAKNTSVVVG